MIEVIAAEAEVSTRTIYNHFENKEQLFSTVLTERATQVADARDALIDKHGKRGLRRARPVLARPQ
ncbi:TetR family transcriptional regulator [Amycolatopsis pigmentata]|uniref:TetR family transcriptional regulator n=1 Tax=Amycolatopsis pigmentata TaxID=450801 RepID=A0ABW5FMC2_9PSEU